MSAYPVLSSETSLHGPSSTSSVKLVAAGVKVHTCGGIGSVRGRPWEAGFAYTAQCGCLNLPTMLAGLLAVSHMG